VFDCSFRPQNGVRLDSLHGARAHDGAVQPFISGAISKTINMPEDAPVEES
jgi:ribonucleoside-diphosphate reductase alpha chain